MFDTTHSFSYSAPATVVTPVTEGADSYFELGLAYATGHGEPVDYALARWEFRGKQVLNGVVHLPLILPPVVTGYLLLLTFGRKGYVGQFLHEWFGIVLAFRWTGAVLAAAVMAFPLMVRAIRLFDMRFEPYPPFWLTAVLAGAIYLNFFTHHYIGDYRWYLAACALGLGIGLGLGHLGLGDVILGGQGGDTLLGDVTGFA